MKELTAEELKNFGQSHTNIVIYGAGVMGQALYCLFKGWGLESNVKGFAVSPEANSLPSFMEVPIKKITEYDLGKHTFIIASKWMFAEKIAQHLIGADFVYCGGEAMKAAYCNGVKGIDKYIMDSLIASDLSDTEFVSACVRQIRREKLDFEVNVVDHCNLNCQCCNHFSPIAKKYFLPVEEFERDLKRIFELTDGELERIWLSGGEALLHPQILNFMLVFRKYFPTTQMKVLTNGTLIMRQEQEFWQTVRETDAELVLTKYPVNCDYDEIDKKMAAEKVKFSYSVVSTDTLKTTYRLPLVENSDMNPVMNYLKCWHANECVTLRNGRIYTCPIAAHAHYFNEYFGKSLYVGDKNSIDIYKVRNLQEIFDFLKKPIPFCKHCNIRGYSFDIPWAVSKKQIEEWT